jgi:phosphate transport system substrate-binding protein
MNIKGQLMEGSIVEYTPPTQVVTPRRILVTLVALSLLVGLLIGNGIGLIGAFLQGNCAFNLSPVNISGSSAFYTTALTQAKAYRETCPIATLNIASSDSAAGLTQLEAKNLDIANSELSPKEAGYPYNDLLEHQVAIIVFTLIVNKDVTGLNSLTQDQITRIYNGSITNWKQVNGPDLPIVLFGRPSGSGTQAAFTTFVLNHPETAIKNPVSSTQEVINGVSITPGAIGYADLGSANNASTTVTELEIAGYAATLGLVASAHYPFWAIERMYTRRDSNALSLSFINYVTNNIRTSDTFIPVTSLSQAIVATHE